MRSLETRTIESNFHNQIHQPVAAIINHVGEPDLKIRNLKTETMKYGEREKTVYLCSEVDTLALPTGELDGKIRRYRLPSLRQVTGSASVWQADPGRKDIGER